MVYNAERDKRDMAMAAFHDERVAAGERRILARGRDGAVHSYTMEEYGVSRAGQGPRLTTVWGHMIYTSLLFLGLIGFICINTSLYFRPIPTPPWGGWLLAVAILAIFLYAAKNLKKEWRAHKLRKQCGLPTPTDSYVNLGPRGTLKKK